MRPLMMESERTSLRDYVYDTWGHKAVLAHDTSDRYHAGEHGVRACSFRGSCLVAGMVWSRAGLAHHRYAHPGSLVVGWIV
jgi:hypothetical protein